MAKGGDTVDLQLMIKRSTFWNYCAMAVWLLVAVALVLLIFRYF
jgi:hypothetical protein